jgi:hypothetical protein
LYFYAIPIFSARHLPAGSFKLDFFTLISSTASLTGEEKFVIFTSSQNAKMDVLKTVKIQC